MKEIIYNDNNLKDEDIHEWVKRAKILVVNSKDEVLIVHTDDSYYLLGGHVDGDESDNECLIREIREEAGLKQKHVAEIMNVTKGSYSMWECGSDTIPLRRLNQFCNHFNVSIDYVVGFSDKKKYSNSTPDIKLKITGQNLKKIRTKKGLTQVAIADELKINQPTWNRYENSKTLILTVVLVELAKKYHYSIDKILGKDKDKDSEENE